MSKRYFQGETAHQYVKVTDVRGILQDPDTIVISIVDVNKTLVVDKIAMTKRAIGEYRYDYLLAADAKIGKWVTEVKAIKGFTQIEQDEFTVMEAL